MYQPMDELLFNMLVGQDWTTEDAIKQVIRDLKMDDVAKDHFLKKVELVEGS